MIEQGVDVSVGGIVEGVMLFMDDDVLRVGGVGTQPINISTNVNV